MVIQNATPVVAPEVVVPAPKKRGRPPGTKNKPKAKPKAKAEWMTIAVGTSKESIKKKMGLKLPRTARAYLNQAMGLKMPTECAAIARLVEIDNRLHRDYDNLWNSVENMGKAEEVKLSGFRQFFVNLFAGQPVKVFAK